VPNCRRWNVTNGDRIDGVTDDQGFPALFESALTSDPKVKIVQFNQSTFPHTTSAVVLISAVNKEAAEAQGQDVLLRNLRIAARAIVGDNNFGWAISASAAPITTEQSLIHLLRHWLRRRSALRRQCELTQLLGQTCLCSPSSRFARGATGLSIRVRNLDNGKSVDVGEVVRVARVEREIICERGGCDHGVVRSCRGLSPGPTK
jgi:hypothetical protein